MSAAIISVEFRSDTIFAVEQDDGVFVAVKPISDALGLKWSGQHERLSRDAILTEGIRVIRMPSVGGGVQETTCLKMELVNGWLFGIDENRVKDDETRQRVLAYKRECYAVLFKHFYGRALNDRRSSIAGDANGEEPTQTKRSLVTETRQTFGTQAARELWFKLGLPTTPAMHADPRQGELFNRAA